MQQGVNCQLRAFSHTVLFERTKLSPLKADQNVDRQKRDSVLFCVDIVSLLERGLSFLSGPLQLRPQGYNIYRSKRQSEPEACCVHNAQVKRTATRI